MAPKITQDVELDVGRSVEELRAVERAAEDVDAAVDDVDDREVTVDAATALARLAELKREAKALADERVAIKAELDAAGIAADVDKVKRELDSIDTSLAVNLDVDEGGVNATTTAVNDVFSEIGVAGADTAIGISQAFNDAAEQAKQAFGPESGIAKALTALGPLGVAALGAGVGGLLYLWQNVKAAQDASAESVRTYIGLLEEVAGNTEEAALRKTLEEFTDVALLQALDKLGLSFLDVAKIIAGDSVPAWEAATDAQERYRDAVARGTPTELAIGILREQYQLTEDQARALEKQALAVENVSAELRTEESELRKATAAYEAKEAIVGRTVTQLGDYRAAVEDLPEEVITALEPYLDPAALERVRAELAAAGKVPVIPEFTGPIAPGYTPQALRLDVNLNNGIVTDPVGLGREIGRFLDAAGRFGWRPV